MTDLISRIGLLEDLGASCYDLDALTGVTGDERTLQEAIMQYPAVDAVPVVHARWEYLIGDYYCSACDKKLRKMSKSRQPKYCERCGARMDEKEDR
mgnify:CR=1 FL=1